MQLKLKNANFVLKDYFCFFSNHKTIINNRWFFKLLKNKRISCDGEKFKHTC